MLPYQIIFPVPLDCEFCQISVPGSGSGLAMLDALLPASTANVMNGRKVLGVVLTPVGTAIEARTDAATAGEQVAADIPREMPGYLIHNRMLLRSTTATAVTVRVTVYLASRAPV
jgi:hypothetical protein